ncbi:acyltransferase [uncultured Microscilla sp.]|uniref:acyltransferase family protein n=1 Tax=uncultured Microscilla sp. TaxID=432653 RepID=UPI0026231575|nr:acyltransferase [uncultured Microscilla sp.]
MKLKYIDALRGIAILGVMAVHTGHSGYNKYPVAFSNLIDQGAKGVQLFFVVSAFTLFLSYKTREKKETHTARNFFIRRFFRIAPLYYMGIVYYLLQDGFDPRFWLGNDHPISLPNIASNFVFAHGINPYWMLGVVPGGWSITVEMTFYLCIPWLIARIRSLNQAVGFTMWSLLFSLALNSLLLAYPLIDNSTLWANYLYLYFPNQLPVFGFGIIAYFLIIRQDFQISTFYLGSLAMLVLSHLVWHPVIPEHVLFGWGFFLLVIALSRCEYSIFVNQLTRFLGKISYSAYLIHFAVIHWLTIFHWANPLPHNTPLWAMLNYTLRLLLVVGITSVLGWASLRLIEQPAQKLGRWLIGRVK